MHISMQFNVGKKSMLPSGGIGRCRKNTPTWGRASVSLLGRPLQVWRERVDSPWPLPPGPGGGIQLGQVCSGNTKYFLACLALPRTVLGTDVWRKTSHMWFLCSWADRQFVRDERERVCVRACARSLKGRTGCFMSWVNGFQAESATVAINLCHIITHLIVLG